MSFSQGHALLIGVGTYQHEPRLNVPITAADARAVAAVLRDPKFCGYPEDQISVLCDAAASRDGVISGLDTLAAHANEDDTVLLFFCGHGDYGDDGDYYLTTHDTRLKNGQLVSGSGLRQSELIDKLRAVKAKRLLLLVNACHSGELAPTLGADETPFTGSPLPNNTAAALLATGEGRIIITACRESQVSYIGAGKRTLFTEALVNGLQGHGTSSTRGYLSAFDLYTHIYFTIEEAVRQKYGKTQEPELTVLEGVGPFAVSLYLGATTLGEMDMTSSPPEGTAIREVNPAYAQAMLRQFVQHIGDTYEAHLTGSGAIAQGEGATAIGERAVYVGGKSTGNINTGTQVGTVTQGISPSDLEPLFAQLLAAVVQHAAEDRQAAAVQQVQALEAEVAKGEQAEDGHIATIVHGLAGMVPKAVGTLVSTFATPILSGIAGPVTKLVLDQLKGNGASGHGIDTD